MRVMVLSALSVILLAIAAFCVIGFLASAEASAPGSFRLIYGLSGGLCVSSIVALWLSPRIRRRP